SSAPRFSGTSSGRDRERSLIERAVQTGSRLDASSGNPEALPRLPKSPPKAGERRAGPFAHAADGLSRPFLAVAVANVANRPFDALSTSPAPGRQNLADEVDTHTEAGLELGRFFLVWGS